MMTVNGVPFIAAQMLRHEWTTPPSPPNKDCRDPDELWPMIEEAYDKIRPHLLDTIGKWGWYLHGVKQTYDERLFTVIVYASDKGYVEYNRDGMEVPK